MHAARELQVLVAPVRLHILDYHDRILHGRALLVPDREVQVQGTRARGERDSLADRNGIRTGFHGHLLHRIGVVRGRDGDARRKGLHRAVRIAPVVEVAAVRGADRIGLARALQVRAGDLVGDDGRTLRIPHEDVGTHRTRRAQGNDPGVGVVRAARRDRPLNPAIVVAGLRGRDRDAGRPGHGARAHGGQRGLSGGGRAGHRGGRRVPDGAYPLVRL